MDQPSVPAGGTASILWDGPLSQPVVHWGQPSDATGARPGAAAGARPCQASQSQATGRDGAVLCEALGKLHKPLRGSSSGGLGWEGGRQAGLYRAWRQWRAWSSWTPDQRSTAREHNRAAASRPLAAVGGAIHACREGGTFRDGHRFSYILSGNGGRAGPGGGRGRLCRVTAEWGTRPVTKPLVSGFDSGEGTAYGWE